MMFKSKLLWTGALAALGLVTAAAYAEPTQQDLLQKINDLQSQVAQLQANQTTQQHQLDARDVDSTVNSVLNDADSHSMLVDGTGVTAGWDKKMMGFFVASEDGSSMLHPGLIWKYTGVANWKHNTTGGGNDSAVGFENTVLEPYVCGNVFTKDMTFKLLYDSASGSPTLTDMYVQYVFSHNVLCGGDLAVKGGQFVDPTFKEQSIGDANVAAELVGARSLLNALIGGGLVGPRVQGVELLLVGDNSPVHLALAYTDGAQGANTDFQQIHSVYFSPVAGHSEVFSVNWGVAARADWKLMGDWKDADKFTAKGNKQDLLVVGLGGNVTEICLDGMTGGVWEYMYSADVQYCTMDGKLSLYAAALGNDLKTRNNPGTDNLQCYGLLVQAGYLVTDSVEVFARWDWTHLDGELAFLVDGGQNNFHELTAGVNYYLGDNGAWGNHAKLTVDISYLPQGTPVGVPAADVLGQGNGRSELVVGAQFTLWI